MKFKMGSPIPDELIAKRFEDEDGEIFVELYGMENYLFRVTDGNRYFYRIEKIHMEGETLKQLANPTAQEKNDFTPSGYSTTQQNAVPGVATNPLSLDEMSWVPASDTETIHSMKALEDKPADKMEWHEGQKIPDAIKPLCKPNEYGGYTLRYNKFLYLLNKNYTIDVKSPDANYNYMFEETPHETPSPQPATTQQIAFTPSELPSTDFQHQRVTIAPIRSETPQLELAVGDILPSLLRNRCENNLGPQGGCQITLGDFIYILNNQYTVIQKMKMNVTPSPPTKPSTPKPPPPPQPKPVTVREVLDMMIKTVSETLEKYKIEASYFKDTVLINSNREVLIRAINGDLSLLNDDTREAAKQGKIMTLQEKGFDLLKAIFIHELYIKSTLTGRGDKMKFFLSDIAALNHDGTMDTIQDKLSLDNKIQLLKFFKDRAEIYADKTDIILRVYLQIRNSIIPTFNELLKEGELLRFDAFLIAKLYEFTTRIDRGDGLTMIRLTRAILKYTKALET